MGESMDTNVTAPTTKEPAPQLYQALMAMYLHADGLIWARVRDLIVLQGFVMASAFALRGAPLAWALPAFGSTLTIWMLLATKRFIRDRDVNLGLMDELAHAAAGSLGSKYSEQMKEKWKDSINSPVRLRGAGDAPFWKLRNTTVLLLAMVLFAIVDAALVVVMWKYPHLISPAHASCEA